MRFIQVIEYRTTRYEEMRQLMQQWMDDHTDSPPGFRWVRNCRDRDDQTKYFDIIEFDNYELAMQNSNSAETTQMAEQFAKLCDEGPTFRNLDLLDIHEA